VPDGFASIVSFVFDSCVFSRLFQSEHRQIVTKVEEQAEVNRRDPKPVKGRKSHGSQVGAFMWTLHVHRRIIEALTNSDWQSKTLVARPQEMERIIVVPSQELLAKDWSSSSMRRTDHEASERCKGQEFPVHVNCVGCRQVRCFTSCPP
jgi:hypothetical protein